MKKFLILPGAALLICGSGYLGGAVFAATQDGETQHETVTAAPTYKEDLPPFTYLENGASVGEWRAETPLDERPDFVRTKINGKVGYLKLSDISDGFVWPDPSDGPVNMTKEWAAAEKRSKETMIQPNANGQILAPVYGEDGVTVIGKQLMNLPADQKAP